MLENFTLVISGPIRSRLSSDNLKKSFNFLEHLNEKYGLKIIISTYKNEVPSWVSIKKFTIVINDDPGVDKYHSAPWPMGTSQRNTSRMLKLTSNGLNFSNTSFTVKSRIELLPDNNKFIEMCKNFETHIKAYPTSIFVIREHYYGTSHPSKSVLCWLPDTFQIMETQKLGIIWSTAAELWFKYNIGWHEGIKFPLTNEQILGLSFYRIYFNIPDLMIKNFYRFKYSKTIFKQNLVFESQYIGLVSFADTGLTMSKLSRSRKRTLNMQRKYRKRLEQNRFYFAALRLYKKHTVNKVSFLKIVRGKIYYEFNKLK